MILVNKTWGSWAQIQKRFRWNIPEYFNIAHEVCDKHTAIRDEVALWYETAHGHEQSFTFGQIQEFSNRFANALIDLGLTRGDRVGIILPQRPETAISHIAIYKAGGIALPLSVLFGADALKYRLEDSGTKFLITDQSRWPTLEEIRDDLPNLEHIIICGGAEHDQTSFWDRLNAGSARFTPVQTRAEDPAFLIYTSGTTGPPKGALHAHRSLLGNLTGFEMSHNFLPQAGDRFWTPADWAWAGGLLDGLLPCWYYGIPILAYEGGKFDPEKAFDLLEKYQIRNAFIPPTALKLMMQVPARERFQIRLRSVMSAGEAVGGEIIRWGQTHLNLTINEMWGQTEINYLVGNCAEILAVNPGSMGKPYPGHTVGIIDEQGQVLPPDAVGEFACLKGTPAMFLGYWNQPQATQDKFIGDWCTTGDIGYRDEAGYLWFMGRKDDVISSAGYRIGPTEIEDCLLKHPAVAQSAVIGVPDELRGNIIKAFIVPTRGHKPSPALINDIQQHVRGRLAAYEYPREIEFIDELPLTTTGKVRRIQLRRREMARRDRKS
ncbi:MAG: AMP-binding protein [Candidatus Poribacteria bacterium]|nr:AMP-binding protein [Candidatus Poribacteria bacterium]